MSRLDPEFDWLEACPLCSGQDLRIWEASARGYSVQPLRVRCHGCGLVFANPQASLARLEHFYQHVYFSQADYKGEYFTPASRAEQLAKGRAMLALAERHASKGRLLDVGCAAGYLLEAARERGWKAEGVELSRAAAAQARRAGFKVWVGRAEDLRLAPRYQLVYTAHTLEHVKDPRAYLQRLRGFLAPQGRLMIEVPNAYHLWALIWHYGPRLRLRTAPLTFAKEHTFDFSRATLGRLLKTAGLEAEHFEVVDYEKGPLRLWRKDGEGRLKTALRTSFVGLAKALRMENLVGSYLRVVARRA